MLDLVARKAIALTDVCYVRVLLVLDLVARKATAWTDDDCYVRALLVVDLVARKATSLTDGCYVYMLLVLRSTIPSGSYLRATMI